MDASSIILTVYFEEPFWVGMCERESSSGYEACKITFGPEPKEGELYRYLNAHWYDMRYSPSMDVNTPASESKKHMNPKRLSRAIQKEVHGNGREKGAPGSASTKAQQAMQLMREQHKLERKSTSRAKREEEDARKYALRQEKRKEKHRGH